MTFKQPSQLTDAELRAAFAGLATQVDALEKVVVSCCGLLLAAHDEWEEPPCEVRAAMLEMLAEYSQQVIGVQAHLERMYAEEIASTNRCRR